MPPAQPTWQLVTARTAREHGVPIRRSHKPNQPDDIADQHQEAAGRQRRIIDPHRKAQIRGAMLVDRKRGSDDLPAVPGQRGTKDDGRDAVEYLHPSLHAGRDDVEHEVGPDMAVGANQLTGHDHDRPDQQIDDDLLGIADRLPAERSSATRPATERSASAARPSTPTSVCSARSQIFIMTAARPGLQPASAISAETAKTISGEILDSFATWSWCAIISCRFAASSSGDGTTILMPCCLHQLARARLRGRHLGPIGRNLLLAKDR